MTDEMSAEFATVATWTADVALSLGPQYRLPAACRGSGSPGVLRWFIDRLGLLPETTMLDCGAGVGGPAAFAAEEVQVRPVLTEPEFEACLASRRLFDFPAVQASFPLPFASGSFEAVWSLGVLCTVDDQGGFLRELRRVLTTHGRLGLLVFVATRDQLSDQPAGNHFPTADGLRQLLDDAGFRTEDSATQAEFAQTSNLWQERVDAVEAELGRRHGSDPVWRTAAEQSALIGRLLADEELVGTMIVTRPEAD